MKIVLAMPEFPPDNVGGGGEVAAALLSEYRKHNEVRLVAGRIGIVSSVPHSDSSVHWIEEAPFPRRFPFLASTMPPTPRGLLRLANLVKDADVIHIHGYGFPLIDAIAWIARRRRIPYVHTLHGFPVTPGKRGGWVARVFQLYRIFLGDRTLRNAAAHTAVSESVARLFREEFGIEATVIPNGVTAMPRAPRTRVDSAFTILCVGRLEWIKDFATVIRAISRVPGDVRLRIAGRDNGAQETLLQTARDHGVVNRLELLGYLDRQRLAEEYANADCCVMSSVTEAFPAVPLEAMNAGVPVISTPVGGVLEYGIDGWNVLLFQPGDYLKLAELFEIVRGDEAKADLLVSNGRETAERYSWERVSRRYHEVFAAILSGGRS